MLAFVLRLLPRSPIISYLKADERPIPGSDVTRKATL